MNCRPRTRAIIILVIALVLAGTIPSSAFAVRTVGLRADVNGSPIPLATVGQYYCHDFDWPSLHCFTADAALEDAVHSAAARRAFTLGKVDAVTALSYVRLYDLSGYAGPFIYLSANYNDLSVIGWNDRASSYVAVNSLTSGLYVNTSFTGATLLLCCNQHSPSLSSTFDNQISSARRT